MRLKKANDVAARDAEWGRRFLDLFYFLGRLPVDSVGVRPCRNICRQSVLLLLSSSIAMLRG
jgi:hypothetical protein